MAPKSKRGRGNSDGSGDEDDRAKKPAFGNGVAFGGGDDRKAKLKAHVVALNTQFAR